jgi:uncharacterized Zn finger protein
MVELVFSVQGSAIEPYRVTFRKEGNSLSASCTCPASDNGLSCKHRVRILSGITEGIVSGNENKVGEIPAIIKGTDLEKAMIKLEEAEIAHESAKKQLAKAKKLLAMAMRG